jgi:hypothetical protein
VRRRIQVIDIVATPRYGAAGRYAPRMPLAALAYVVLTGCSAMLFANLPLYPRLDMERAQMSHGGGDEISYHWTASTLPGQYHRREHAHPEEMREQTLAAALAVWLGLSLTPAIAVALFRRRRSA